MSFSRTPKARMRSASNLSLSAETGNKTMILNLYHITAPFFSQY
jgi:hypothetical protein